MGRRPTVNLNLPPRMRVKRLASGVFYYYDQGGKPRKWVALGSDYVLAVQAWATLHKAAPAIRPTVGWSIAKYLASPSFDELSAGTQADYRFALDKLLEHFGDAPLDEVRSSHLVAYLEHRGKGSKHRAQREVNVLGRIFKFARSHDWTKNDPKESVEMKRLPGRKGILITDDMADSVYEAAGVVLRDCMDLAYLIGQRPADVLKLAETDIQNGAIQFRQNKTDEPMRIAVSGELAKLLDRIAERKRQYPVRAFALLVDERGRPMTKAKLRQRFESAREVAGIAGKDFQFRDLRRKAATDLREQSGVEAAQDLLGHKSVVMTEHYTAGLGRLRSTIAPKPARLKGAK